jgi:hypothetical protein
VAEPLKLKRSGVNCDSPSRGHPMGAIPAKFCFTSALLQSARFPKYGGGCVLNVILWA